jgi:peroxiredoxin/outer membrane lipoprotein-sorting protein
LILPELTMRNAAIRIFSAGLLAFGAAGWPGAVTAAGSLPLAGEPEGVAQAKEALERARAAYAALSTYRDRVHIKLHGIAVDDGAEPPTHEAEFALLVARPGRYSIRGEYSSIICDGRTLWIVDDNKGEYLEQEAPRQLVLEDLKQGQIYLDAIQHPLAAVLLEDSKHQLLLPQLSSVDGSQAQERRGEAGILIRARGAAPDLPIADDLPITIWISQRTGLVGEIVMDLTDAWAAMREMQVGDDEDDPGMPHLPRLSSMVLRYDFTSIRIDEELPDDAFKLNPRGMMRVEEFISDWGGNDAYEMVGERAPDFTLPDLDGQEVKLSDLRGSIVVLDFWAIWCAPCVQALPHIQKLHERYEGKPVRILGVNRDRPGSGERVRTLLERREITFRQVLDEAGDAAGKFNVSGIPHMVIIDQQGVIREVKVGFAPGQEEVIAGTIDALLEGREVAAARPPAPRQREIAPEEPQPALPDEVEPQRLAGEPGRGHGNLSLHNLWRIDVDGDGQAEFIAADHQGALHILEADGAQRQRIRLQGRRGDQHVQGVSTLKIDGQLHWVIILGTYTEQGGWRSEVALFTQEGSRVWSHRPDVADGDGLELRIAAGDFSGDGTGRIVVGLNTYRLRKMNANSYMHDRPVAYLAVLDHDGQVLSKRRIGQRIASLDLTPGLTGKGTAILVGIDGHLRPFTFDPAAEEE